MFKWFAPRIVRKFGLTFVQLEDDQPPLDDPKGDLGSLALVPTSGF